MSTDKTTNNQDDDAKNVAYSGRKANDIIKEVEDKHKKLKLKPVKKKK